jgi:hypothetical protein
LRKNQISDEIDKNQSGAVADNFFNYGEKRWKKIKLIIM